MLAHGVFGVESAAINNFDATTGNLLPQQQFDAEQQELDTLDLELQQANIAGDTAHATALEGLISQREQQLATLAGQLSQYTTLNDARQAAIAVSDHAAQSLNDVESLIAADHASGTVTVQKIGRVSKLADTLKFAAIAFAVALALALGLILLMELMRKPAQSTPAEAPADEGDGDVDRESAAGGALVEGRFGRPEMPTGGRPFGNGLELDPDDERSPLAGRSEG